MVRISLELGEQQKNFQKNRVFLFFRDKVLNNFFLVTFIFTSIGVCFIPLIITVTYS